MFELSPNDGGWRQKVLYNFCSQAGGSINACPDGSLPYGGVTFDAVGNLYGTTVQGGSKTNAGDGVVYELSPSGKVWKEALLAAFPSPNHLFGMPPDGVAIDPKGDLYGSFTFPDGGVFRLNPVTGKYSIFAFDGSDGSVPLGGVTLDPKRGVLYGTTSQGGGGGNAGNIYQIDAQGKEKTLYHFCSQPKCTDGDIPWATLVMDPQGNLYGTTEYGGEYGQGVVFELEMP